VVIGRDARISGEMVQNLVAGTLKEWVLTWFTWAFPQTPTVEMAVIDMKADGGIIITASHNPKQWNALKLLK
jgi:phosphomannomutase